MRKTLSAGSQRAIVAALAIVILVGLGYWLLAPRLPGAAAAELEGKTWQLTALNSQPPAPGSRVTLTFKDGKVGGNSGVNQFGGSYRASAGSVTLSGIASTMMASTDPALNQQEQAVLNILQGQLIYRVSGNQLELSSPAGTLLFQ